MYVIAWRVVHGRRPSKGCLRVQTAAASSGALLGVMGGERGAWVPSQTASTTRASGSDSVTDVLIQTRPRPNTPAFKLRFNSHPHAASLRTAYNLYKCRLVYSSISTYVNCLQGRPPSSCPYSRLGFIAEFTYVAVLLPMPTLTRCWCHS